MRRPPLLEDIEPRLLYSADHPAALAALAAAPGSQWQQIAASTPAAQQQPGVELVFVDSRVANASQLEADISAQAEAGRAIEAVSLRAGEDGIAQISAVLSQHSDVAAIHLISHGSEGEVQLGSSTLDPDTLLLDAAQIAGWRSHLASAADVLIYGCDVGAGRDGQALLQGLAQLTGAAVAASSDATGSAALGGNWTLEVQAGRIEVASAIDAGGQAAWLGLLAAPVFASNGGGASAAISVPENSTAVTTVAATGSGAISYSISGGADAARFSINASSGVLAFATAPNFEAPTDAGANNVYDLVVQASDGTLASTQAIAVTVTDVNDAPLLGPAAPVLTPLAFIDTGNAGQTVASIVAASISDADAGAVQGIAITGLAAGTGTWQFSIDGGGSWSAVGTVSAASSLLLRATDQLRFVPNGSSATSASITWRAWDQSDGGTAGSKLATSSNGGATAFSTASNTATVSASIASNTAPTLRSIGSGTSIFDVPGSADDEFQSVVTQPDGKIVAVGYASVGGHVDAVVFRYNVDGSLDTTFGVTATGIAYITFAGTDSYGYGVAVQGDGKIVVVGSALSGGNTVFGACRLLANGAADTSFGNAGFVTTSFGTNDVARQVSVLSNGTIVVAGQSTVGGKLVFCVARYTAAGALDASFGPGGKFTVSFASGNGTLYGMAVQADGRIVLVGSALKNGNQDFAAVRLSAAGGLDSSFATSGAYTPLSATDDLLTSVVQAADGSLYLAGRSAAAGTNDMVLMHLGTSGVLDTGFGSNGIASADFGGTSDAALGIVLQSDGKIVAAGSSGASLAIARWTPFGMIDGSFGNAGKASVALDGGSDIGYGVALMPDNRIVAVGTASNRLGIARLGSSGVLDDSFGASAALPNSVAATENLAVVLNAAATVSDTELNRIGNYAGATLTLLRNGGANAQDTYAASGSLGALLQGGSLVYASTTIGTVTTNSAGTLVLTFNANATQALVNAAMRCITCTNTSDAPPASAVINWSFSDGNASAQGSGGALAASSTTTLNITAVNDAPLLAPIMPTLTGITENQISNAGNPGQTVAAFTAGSISDPDGSGLAYGIAITAAAITSGAGQWQYSVDGGSTWWAIGTPSAAASLLLRSTDKIRFMPDGDNGAGASITYRAWDQTSGSAGTSVASTSNGSGSAFSTAIDTASIVVAAVNDAPSFLNPASGAVLADFNNGGDGATATVQQPDGKLLVAGYVGVGIGDMGVARYNADGSLDTSFGSAGTGLVPIQFFGTAAGYGMALQPDGRIIVSGNVWNGANYDFGVMRLNANGTLDTSFGSGGKVFTDFANSADYQAKVLVNSDGTIVLVGTSGGSVGMLRYLANGTLDTSFGTSGKVTTTFGTGTSTVAGTVLLSDGRIVVAATTGATPALDFALLRYNANGTLDTSFGTNGITVTDFAGNKDSAYGMALQADGSLLVSGDIQVANGSYDFGLARYTATGVLDTSFGSNGKVTTDFSGRTDYQPRVAVNADGSIVLAGTTVLASNQTVLALARYLANGTLDTSFGTSGKTVAAVNGNSAAGAALLIQSDGRIVEAGQSYNGSNNDFVVTRFLRNGAVDGTFGVRGSSVANAVASTENAAPVVLDVGLQLADVDLAALGSYAGASLSLQRSGGANAQDLFAGTGALAALATGGNLVYGGSVIGSVTSNAGGLLQLAFNGNATQALVNAALRSIGYANSSDVPPASVLIAWSFNDGNGAAAQGSGGALGATGSTTVSITPVNDAPVLVPFGPVFPSISEDQQAGSGLTVAALVGSSISDPDGTGLQGIAVYQFTSVNGKWQYSVNAGASWTDLGAVNNNAALLLRSIDLLRFVPDGRNATVATIGYGAWDRTDGGTPGTTVPTSVNGGSSSLSLLTDVATINVSAVNDAPVLSAATPLFTPINEDQAGNLGQSVESLLGSTLSDVDSGALGGIAITSFNNGGLAAPLGWQYSIDGGASWAALSGVGPTSALLLRSTDLLRVVPDGLNGGNASIGYVAWDQSDGRSPGTFADSSNGGGSLAFSSTGTSASIVVNAVNDAPSLTAIHPALAQISEDQTTAASNPGVAVGSFLGSSIADVDSAALQGIAVTAVVNGNGKWQYSINGGSSWTDIGSVSDSAALLLRSTDLLRFMPDGKNGTTASLTYRAWDRSAGNAGDSANAGSNGGTSAFSSTTDSLSVIVGSLNDAPALTPVLPQFPGIGEDDIANLGQSVSAMLGTSVVDADAGALAGVAITTLSNGSGQWQYSLDGGTTWSAVSGVSPATALLLRGSDKLRFVPDGLNGTTASLGYVAWDRSDNRSAGSLADSSTGGGSSAFSSNGDSASVTVGAVNDAPTLTAIHPSLAPISEDAVMNLGEAVATFLGSSIGDVDSSALQGIAITAVANGNSRWQYSTNGGISWTDVGSVSDSAALLLRATDLLRYLPDGRNGTAASFTYRAWDQSSGSAGNSANATVNGGSSAFSSATDSASITVGTLNDAPALSALTPQFPAIGEDDTANLGQTVAAMLGSSVADVDTSALQGVAVTTLNNGNGAWQYSLDGGTAWSAVSGVGATTALLLRGSDRLRFVPDGHNGSSASLGYVAWDQSDNRSAGSLADSSNGGGISAFSSAGDSASITVNPVNDAPVLTALHPSFASIDEDDITNLGQTVASFLGSSIADVDSPALQGIAIAAIGNGNGKWQYSTNGGAGWTTLASASDDAALLLRASDRLRFVPDGRNGTTASLAYRAWDQSAGSAGNNADTTLNGGTSAFSIDTDSVAITVGSLNDAPALTPAAPQFPAIDEDDVGGAGRSVATLLGSSVADVDSGALQGIAITSSSNGNGAWQYSLDNGTHWAALSGIGAGTALLLRGSDLLRFQPDGVGATSASLGYVAWDQSDNRSAGSLADASDGGGASAFSSAGDTASITVGAVNDAPLLAAIHPGLAPISEDDTANPGQSVASFIGSSIADPDGVSALQGIALTASANGGGKWQYSISAGSSWADVGSVSNSAALLLRSTDLLRFVPDGRNGTTATLTYRAWDQSAGSAGSSASTAANGGSSAFSLDADTASITVGALNDAPVLNGANHLAAINENPATNPGTLVSTLIAGKVVDADSGAVAGIAVTAVDDSNGSWQYTTDGGANWQALAGTSNASARLLAADAQTLVRFVPNVSWNGTVTNGLTLRAWDRSAGSAGGLADTAVNGGLGAFSSASASTLIIVTTINDAPIGTDNRVRFDGDTSRAFTVDDFGLVDPSGASLLEVRFNTVPALGSIRLGNTAVTAGQAVSAIDIAAGQLVYTPPLYSSGDAYSSFTFQVRDDGGIANGRLDTDPTPRSFVFDITPVPHAPELTPATPSLGTIDEDAVANTGQTVASFAGTISDVDAGALQGIAITAADAGNGRWEYSLDGGSHWLALGAASSGSARLLDANNRLRFVPNGLQGTTASISYVAWDQTSGSVGSTGNTGTRGGATAFSLDENTAALVVGPVNDAPALTPIQPALLPVNEDDVANPGQTVASFVANSIGDVDASLLRGIAITALDPGNGSWQYSLGSGGSWQAMGNVAAGSARLLGADDSIRFVPNTKNATTASISYVAWDQTPGSGLAGDLADSRARGGSGAFSTASDSATIHVGARNDAPTLIAFGPALAQIDEDDVGNLGQTVASFIGTSIGDVDSGAVQGIAIITASPGNGRWETSIDGGSQWSALGTPAGGAARLLDAANLIRFVPNGLQGTTASIGYVAWDQSSGSAGSTADASVRGGGSAFSLVADSATLLVSSVNDAPVLQPRAPAFTAISEDDDSLAANPGRTVASLIGSSIGDVDGSPQRGIAITGLNAGGGQWQYTVDGGITWKALLSASPGQALLLDATSTIRFVPDTKNASSASISYAGWDESAGSGLAGDVVDATLRGGSGAFSLAGDSATITVTALNDAPQLGAATPTLAGIDEDIASAANPGRSVASLVGSTITDDDTGAVQGIAIIGTGGSTNGAWQYSTDGGAHWTGLGVASAGSARLLDAADLVRFMPDGLNGGVASFSYRAWDETAGSRGSTADSSLNGGTTAFSASANTASITVQPANDAPVLTPIGPQFPALGEDDASLSANPGLTVANLVGSSIGDVDSVAPRGIAITGFTASHGHWDYSLDGGASWSTLLSAGSGQALLLAGSDQLRFVPDTFNGGSATIAYRAWDQSDNLAHGSTADTSINGGTSAFSPATDNATVTVADRNDAPHLAAATPVLPSIDEDAAGNLGRSVAWIVGATIGDDDANALQGIAVTGTANGNGAWQYSTDGGSHWSGLASASAASAVLLGASDLVRFLPDGENGTAASFGYVAWDQTSGHAGSTADTRVNGATTAFSSTGNIASIVVTSLNDAPVLTPIAPALLPISEDDIAGNGQTVASFIGSSIGDVDASALQGIAVIGAGPGNGRWQYAIGGSGTWTNFTGLGATTARLLDGGDRIRFVPDGNSGTSATLSYVAWDQSDGTQHAGDGADSTLARGGLGAFSLVSDTAMLQVASANDAPSLTVSHPSLPGIDEDELAPAGRRIADLLGTTAGDVDGSAPLGIAVTGTVQGHGEWQFSIDGATQWKTLVNASDASATLLGADALIRFAPDGRNGSPVSFTYRAWDGTSGSNGATADASLNGGSTAFSSSSDSASLVVASLNDSPTISPLQPTLPALTEDDIDNLGQTVAWIVGTSIDDVDAAAQQGVAVTNATAHDGQWQYSLDGGNNWASLAGVSNGVARLLRASDRIRFAPDGEKGTFAQLDYVAWDQTAGQAGGSADTTTRGGESPFSLVADDLLVDVSDVNDAPVLVPRAPALAPVSVDDPTSAGQTVSTILGNAYRDVDDETYPGIAITGSTHGAGGQWQSSVDAGQSWHALGNTSTLQALLLREEDKLRFVPDGLNTGSATISYVAWDQTDGDPGSLQDASVRGGASYFSLAGDTATLAVLPINHAPVLQPAQPVLATIDEDATGNAGQTVASVVDGLIGDGDAGALQGIAITSLAAGNGSWAYSIDAGVSWSTLASASAGSALLLRASDRLRFVPDERNGTAASFGFVAWDQTSGSAGGRADASLRGAKTAFSLVADSASISVTPVNDAPVLSPLTPTLSAITEDQVTNGGQSVASFLGTSIGDVDSGAVQGIAIMASSPGNGGWAFSIDGGASWSGLGEVSRGSALLLRSNDLIRFVPDGQNVGSASIGYVAWDQSAGSAGGRADVALNGGTTAFGSAADSASIMVGAVNDAPVLAPIAPALAAITEDDAANPGQTVASLIGASVSDVDAGALQGIAIVAADAGNGRWEYALGDGTGWQALGRVSDAAARLLRPGDLIRFVPDAQAGALAASIAYRAWDQASGTAGALADTSTSGGTSAFSVLQDTARISVLATAEPPRGADKTLTLVENQRHVFAASDFGFSDPGGGQLLAVRIATLPESGSLLLTGAVLLPGQFVGVQEIDAGRLVYVPAANVSGIGVAAFGFQVQSDRAGALDPVARRIGIDISAVDANPSGSDHALSLLEDTAYVFAADDFGFTAAVATPGDELTGVLVTSLPASGNLSLHGQAVSAGQAIAVADIAAGALQFRPAANANGAAYAGFDFQVQGRLASDLAPKRISIAVSAVNDAPSGAAATVGSLHAPSHVFSIGDFGFSDADDRPANALLAVLITSLPANGSLGLNGVSVVAGQSVAAADIAAGLLQFSADASVVGVSQQRFTFQVQDDGGTAFGGLDRDPQPKTMSVLAQVTALPVINTAPQPPGLALPPPLAVPAPPAAALPPISAMPSPAAATVATASSQPATPVERAAARLARLDEAPLQAAAATQQGGLRSARLVAETPTLHVPAERRFAGHDEHAWLIEYRLQQQSSLLARGSSTLRSSPLIALPATDAAPTTSTAFVEALTPTAIGGLVISVGLLGWANRSAGLLAGLSLTTPVWRGFDLRPMLREAARRRGVVLDE